MRARFGFITATINSLEKKSKLMTCK